MPTPSRRARFSRRYRCGWRLAAALLPLALLCLLGGSCVTFGSSCSAKSHCGVWLSSSVGATFAQPAFLAPTSRRLLVNSCFIAEALGIFGVWVAQPALAEEIGATTSEDDIRLLRAAQSAFNKVGDFPSKASLLEADVELTAVLRRSQELGSVVSPSQVPAILRKRSFVRLRGPEGTQAALRDLNEAMRICEPLLNDASVRYEEMPKLYVARAEALALEHQWKPSLDDFDAAAELLGEPLENAPLLSGRAGVKQRLMKFAAAADDYDAAATVLRSTGYRAEAEIEAERAGIALLSAGLGRLKEAEERLCGVIRRTIGLMSEDVALLQRVVIADSDARMAMAAIAWHQGRAEVADTYWRDGCARLNILEKEAQGEKLIIGFPNGETYGCSRYVSDLAWLSYQKGWPGDAIAWLQDFLRNRPSEPPRASYAQDLQVGRRPGDGSTFIDLMIATDALRRRSD